MKKNRLPVLTFLGIGTIVLILSFISFKYIYETSKEKILQSQIQSGQREAREIGKLLEQQLKSGLSKETVIKNLQLSILNTDVQTEFICMYNTRGIELCHPNPALVGQIIYGPNSTIKTGSKEKEISFLQWLQQGKSQGALRLFPGNKSPSQIVNVYPVEETDWLVALHVNTSAVTAQFSNLFTRFFWAYLISALVLIISCYSLVRVIYRKYENSVEGEKNYLNKEIDGLALLNRQLSTSQERLQKELMNASALPHPEAAIHKVSKKRIVTYHRDELITLNVDDTAFIYLKNGITCLHTFDKLNYTINDSLDEIMKDLDNINFYRANRQLIVNIRAIKTIQVYGNNQLKLVMEPGLDLDMIISKNKVAEFKKWLNQ